MNTPRATRRRRRLPAPQRREQLLDIAADIIREQGVEAVNMEKIAARAGVSKSIVYRSFRNRDQLLVDMYERELKLENDRMLAAIDGATSTADALRRSLETYFDMVAERGELQKRLEQSRVSEQLVERADRRVREVEEYFASHAMRNYRLWYQQAITLAALFVSGPSAVVDLWLKRGWSREEIIDTCVRAELAAVETVSQGPVEGVRSGQ